MSHASVARHLPAEPQPDSRWSTLAQGMPLNAEREWERASRQCAEHESGSAGCLGAGDPVDHRTPGVAARHPMGGDAGRATQHEGGSDRPHRRLQGDGPSVAKAGARGRDTKPTRRPGGRK